MPALSETDIRSKITAPPLIRVMDGKWSLSTQCGCEVRPPRRRQHADTLSNANRIVRALPCAEPQLMRFALQRILRALVGVNDGKWNLHTQCGCESRASRRRQRVGCSEHSEPHRSSRDVGRTSTDAIRTSTHPTRYTALVAAAVTGKLELSGVSQ